MTIDVHPKPGLKLIDLHLDERSYKRVADEHVRGIVYYTNNQEGISITVGLTELKVESFRLGSRLRFIRIRPADAKECESGRTRAAKTIRAAIWLGWIW